MLRGPSGKRHVCDVDLVVGGCERSFNEEDGVLCECCSLFLCNACFGSILVSNECQQGGRYDLVIGEEGSSGFSPSGSLPCPLFPQHCSQGQVPLVDIQRALLHRGNRGHDGEREDIHSPGHSPHKLHLLARQRIAQAQLPADAGESIFDALESTFFRTITETRVLSTVQIGADLARAVSGTRAEIAEKQNEVNALKKQLKLHPPADAIPKGKKRVCAHCAEEFAWFEGGQCYFFRNSHFLCMTCFGGYLMKACSPGGCYEQEIKADGVVVSAPGCLPCPFWQGHTEPQLLPARSAENSEALGLAAETVRNPLADDSSFTTWDDEPNGRKAGAENDPAEATLHEAIAADAASQQAPPDQMLPPPPPPRRIASTPTHTVTLNHTVTLMDCHCGAVDMSTIERILLDPRNRSPQFWREKRADSVIHSLTGVDVTAPRGWSRETELLGRGFCPANVFETAQVRLALLEDSAANAARRELAKQKEDEMSDPEEVALAQLRLRVVDALDRGGSIQCPRCGVRAVKDDACVHMDSCPCGSHWCFLCGKECGREPGQCPRGEGGCDQRSCFLEQMDGWGGFALEGESAAFGAQKEFLRRRQAYLVRKVKEEADADLWRKLRDEQPKLLSDVPTHGRSIGWGELDTASFPLFGANLAAGVDGESLIADIAIADDDAAQQRMERHWADLRREAEAAARRERLRKRQKAFCPPIVTALFAALIIAAQVVPTTNPAMHSTFEGCCDTPVAFGSIRAARQGFYTVLNGCQEICEWGDCTRSGSPEWYDRSSKSRLSGSSMGLSSSTMDACCCCGGGRNVTAQVIDARGAVSLDEQMNNWTNTTGASCRVAPSLENVMPNCSHLHSTNQTATNGNHSSPCESLFDAANSESTLVPEVECNWACALLRYLPATEFVLATSVFAVAVAIDLDSIRTEMANDCFLISAFLVACPAVAYWPALFNAEDWVASSWFVAYVLAPFCAGGLGTMWCWGFWVNVFVTKLVAVHREPSETVLGASFIAGFAVYLGLVVAFRAMVDSAEDSSADVSIEPLVTYTCTWPCVAFFWVVGVTLFLTICMLAVDIVASWRHVWRSGWYWRIPVTFVILVDTIGWPLLVGPAIADPAYWYFYLLVPPTIGLSWTGIIAVASQHAPNNRLQIIGLEWHLSRSLTVLGAVVSGWLLWVFRHSVDPENESVWTRTVFWEVVVLGLVGGLLAAYMRLYDRTDVSWWWRTMGTCGWPLFLWNGALHNSLITSLVIISVEVGFVIFSFRATERVIEWTGDSRLERLQIIEIRGEPNVLRLRKVHLASLAQSLSGLLAVLLLAFNIHRGKEDAPDTIEALCWWLVVFGVSMFASYISPIIATEIHKRQDAARERAAAAAAAALAGSGGDVIDRDGDLSQQERDDLEFARELQRQLDELDNHPGAGVWLRPAPAPPVDAEADRPAPPRPPAPADIVDALVDPPPPPPDEPPPRPPAVEEAAEAIPQLRELEQLLQLPQSDPEPQSEPEPEPEMEFVTAISAAKEAEDAWLAEKHALTELETALEEAQDVVAAEKALLAAEKALLEASHDESKVAEVSASLAEENTAVNAVVDEAETEKMVAEQTNTLDTEESAAQLSADPVEAVEEQQKSCVQLVAAEEPVAEPVRNAEPAAQLETEPEAAPERSPGSEATSEAEAAPQPEPEPESTPATARAAPPPPPLVFHDL